MMSVNLTTYIQDRVGVVYGLRWDRQAVVQNEAIAQTNIWVFYHNGLGVTQDYAEEQTQEYGLATYSCKIYFLL